MRHVLVVNALSGGYDYSNGGTHWDGYDFAGKGLGHIKVRAQGVEMSQEHIDAFIAAWSKPGKLSAFSGGAFKTVSSTFSAGIHPAKEGINKGRVLYKSTAVLGNTIFWGPNLNAGYQIHSTKPMVFYDGSDVSWHYYNKGYDWKYY